MIIKNTITSDHLRLCPLTESDMTLKVRWYNDPAVRKTLVVDEIFELDKTIQWFHTLADNDTRADFRADAADGTPIGITGLIDIDRKNKTAQCYCVIGDRHFWGRGLAPEIHAVLSQWAFATLDLDKIWAHIRTNNPAIYRVVEKLGFVKEGTLRQDAVVDGKRIDLYHIGLLREEFVPVHTHYELQ